MPMVDEKFKETYLKIITECACETNPVTTEAETPKFNSLLEKISKLQFKSLDDEDRKLFGGVKSGNATTAQSGDEVYVIDGNELLIYTGEPEGDESLEPYAVFELVQSESRVNEDEIADGEIEEGYTLKKTKVSKKKLSGDPDDYTPDVTVTDTDYEIVNNKTGEVVGVGKVVKNDYFGDYSLQIKMNNGATRYVDIWHSEGGNPQTAFNRFIKDPKTSSKYKK